MIAAAFAEFAIAALILALALSVSSSIAIFSIIVNMQCCTCSLTVFAVARASAFVRPLACAQAHKIGEFRVICFVAAAAVAADPGDEVLKVLLYIISSLACAS